MNILESQTCIKRTITIKYLFCNLSLIIRYYFVLFLGTPRSKFPRNFISIKKILFELCFMAAAIRIAKFSNYTDNNTDTDKDSGEAFLVFAFNSPPKVT